MITDLRQAIADKLNQLEYIGHVHSYERYEKKETDFRTHYKWSPPLPEPTDEVPEPKQPPDEIRGGYIKWLKTNNESQGNKTYKRYDFELNWFLGLNDENATQLLFDELLEQVLTTLSDMAKMNNNNGTPEVFELPNGNATLNGEPQLTYDQHAVFAGVLVHHAKIKFTTILRG